MANYVLLIDSKKCNGCYNCFLACKDEHEGNDHLPVSAATNPGAQLLKMTRLEHGTGSKMKLDFYPTLSCHCVDPKGGTDEAITTTPEGVVTFDPIKAKGRRDLLDLFPAGSVHWNEALELPQSCTLCSHMLAQGEKQPRCSESCPTGAMAFGDLNDPQSKVSKLLAQPQYAHVATETGMIRYLNKPLPFIAGEVLCEGKDCCVEGATLTLTCAATGKTVTTVTDFFGDFQFTDLSAGMDYTINLTLEGYQPLETTISLEKSVNLGALVLNP